MPHGGPLSGGGHEAPRPANLSSAPAGGSLASRGGRLASRGRGSPSEAEVRPRDGEPSPPGARRPPRPGNVRLQGRASRLQRRVSRLQRRAFRLRRPESRLRPEGVAPGGERLASRGGRPAGSPPTCVPTPEPSSVRLFISQCSDFAPNPAHGGGSPRGKLLGLEGKLLLSRSRTARDSSVDRRDPSGLGDEGLPGGTPVRDIGSLPEAVRNGKRSSVDASSLSINPDACCAQKLL